MSDKKKKKIGSKTIIVSLTILIVGMTIGFLLLSLVYDGPVWVKVVFLLVIVVVLAFLIRSARNLIRAIKDEEGKDKEPM